MKREIEKLRNLIFSASMFIIVEQNEKNWCQEVHEDWIRRHRGRHAEYDVLWSKELIGALLACSFFCLFPTLHRSNKHLPSINFDDLFACLYPNAKQSQEHKIKCIVHYFERMCFCMPTGFVSFERKVLPLKQNSFCTSYPNADLWSKSTVPLCSFEVLHSGLIEDQLYEALEVDFANKYIGGGALHSGCVQEEIRFMINPELIVSMLFLPSMEDNEAIEIIGAERFSNYRGYASSFLFSGDHLDKKPIDSVGRRKTRIVAMDALCCPRMRQYGVQGLVREVNKAFCGFLEQSKNIKFFQEGPFCSDKFDQNNDGEDDKSRNTLGGVLCAPASNASYYINEDLGLKKVEDDSLAIRPCNHEFEKSLQSNPGIQSLLPGFSVPDKTMNERASGMILVGSSNQKHGQGLCSEDNVGIATGNWGCGAFGGDPELKCVIQWLAASQAARPFILYHTFKEKALRRLEGVSRWILSQGWTVGDLWNMLLEYSSQRVRWEVSVGFFSWLLPSLPDDDNMVNEKPSMSD